MMAVRLLYLWLAAGSVMADSLDDEFEAFKVAFDRVYLPEEEPIRRQVFRSNMEEAERQAALNPLAKFGAGPFADLTTQEFASRHSGYLGHSRRHDLPRPVEVTTPDKARLAAAATVDWRTKGAVTHVKDQGQCGSCWAFSTTGNIEGQTKVCNGTLVSLSEENLVDCCRNAENDGCNGGDMLSAMHWLVKNQNGTIDTEESYPYTAGHGRSSHCRFHEGTVGARITGGKLIAKDEQQMAAYVEQSGPLAVAVDAEKGWQNYMSGIMTHCKGHVLDHGVLIVGYGSEKCRPLADASWVNVRVLCCRSGQDYWIVKNSWGRDWGEEGYIRLARGVECDGINREPVASEMC